MKNKDVIFEFINGRNAKSHTGSLTSDNNFLYSYGLTIAKKESNIFVVYPASAKYGLFESNTTSKHVSFLLQQVPHSSVVFIRNQSEF